jgi:Ca2+-transporting ATPase
MQLLWINLVSDVFPGLALALEPPEPDVLTRPPRDPLEPILRGADLGRATYESTILSASALAAYGYGISRYGMGPRASTLAFVSLSTAQLVHALSCRSKDHSIFDRERLPRNPYLDAALGGTLGLQTLALTVPWLRRLLGIAPLGGLDYLVIGAGSVLPLMINEATKALLKSGADDRDNGDYDRRPATPRRV